MALKICMFICSSQEWNLFIIKYPTFKERLDCSKVLEKGETVNYHTLMANWNYQTCDFEWSKENCATSEAVYIECADTTTDTITTSTISSLSTTISTYSTITTTNFTSTILIWAYCFQNYDI